MASLPSEWQLQMENFSQRAEYILENKEWTDCSFLLGGKHQKKEISAHKVILAMSSPVFERMFYGPMAEHLFPVPVEDIEPEVFELFLQYIYTGNITLDSVNEIMCVNYAAKKYMIPGLVKICVDKSWDLLSPKTACQIYEFAKFNDEEELVQQCLKVISLDTTEVVADPSFLEIKAATLETILDLDDLSVPSELELYEAVLKWARSECERRDGASVTLRSIVTTILPKIRFLTLKPGDIIGRTASCDLLTDLENYAILTNILSLNSVYVQMPEYFSKSKTKRSGLSRLCWIDKYSWIRDVIATRGTIGNGNFSIINIEFQVAKRLKIVGVEVVPKVNHVVDRRSDFTFGCQSSTVGVLNCVPPSGNVPQNPLTPHVGNETFVVIGIVLGNDGGKSISSSYFHQMKTKSDTEIEFDGFDYLKRNERYVLKVIIYHPKSSSSLPLIQTHDTWQRQVSIPFGSPINNISSFDAATSNAFVQISSFLFQEQDTVKLKLFV